MFYVTQLKSFYRLNSIPRGMIPNIIYVKLSIDRESKRSELMIVGVEIDFVVKDCLEALELYEKIFDIKRVEVSNFPRGQNEVVFTLYDVRFHMLDENPQFHLIAPKPDDPKTMWVNIAVPDIKETYAKANKLGCQEIQPVKEHPDFGISNAIFADPYGYIWMLHQIHKVVSHEERIRHFEEQMSQES